MFKISHLAPFAGFQNNTAPLPLPLPQFHHRETVGGRALRHSEHCRCTDLEGRECI